MRESLYRQALRHSWRLASSHKELWVFGLFAAILGQMGFAELLSKITIAGGKYAALGEMIPVARFRFFIAALTGLPWSIETGTLFLWLVVMLAALCLIGLFVSVVSQGAIIHAAGQSVRRKNLPNTGQAWHAGVDHFWRLLGLNVLKKVILWTLAFIVAVATLNALASGRFWDAVVFLILFILSMVVGLVLSCLVIYAAGYVVIEEYSWWRSFRAAWRLFLDHWLVSVEVGLLLLVYNLALLLVVLAGLFVIMLHTVLLLAVTLTTGVLGLFNVGLFIEFIVFTGFIMFAASVFTVFTTTAWTYLFMRMHKVGIRSHLVRLFHG